MCRTNGDAEYVECSVAGGERKIVGAVDGTLVVIGNSDNAVRTCLEVRRGNRPSIQTDPELLKVRASLASENGARVWLHLAGKLRETLLMGRAAPDGPGSRRSTAGTTAGG